MTWTIAEARSVPCPSCRAAIGQPCKGRPTRHHQRRIDAMVAVRRATKAAFLKGRNGKHKAAPLAQAVIVAGADYTPPREGEVIDYTDVF